MALYTVMAKSTEWLMLVSVETRCRPDVCIKVMTACRT
jgi:hypothetical protein